ncbi:MAG: FAD-dependent oxidoreductase, partial [Bdellovibrionota bacterium]
PGGKLSAFRDEQGSTVEHGMHGWWHQYFNFFDLMKRAWIPEETFLEPIPSTVVFSDGERRRQVEIKRRLPTPLFMLKHMAAMGRIKFWDAVSAIRPFLRMFSFDHEKDFDRFDKLSIYAYLAQCGATRNFHDFAMSPFARSFAFSSTEELSAGSVMSAINFYFIGHQEDVEVRWCRGNPQELVIDPIVRFIEARGGKVRTGTTAAAIEAGRGGVKGVRLGSGGNEVRVPLTQVPASGTLVWDTSSGEKILIRRTGDSFSALSATCTHQGCPVAPSAAGDSYDCPCHGGRFSLDGAVLRGPPERPLESLPVRKEGEELIVGAPGELLTGDFYVLAAEVEAAKRILRNSPGLLRHETFRRILNLESTEVMVARLWLDKKVPEDLYSGVFADLGFLDNYFILSNFQDEFLPYRAEGSVVEVQMYVVKDYIHLSPAELLKLILSELGQRIPELAGAAVRKWHLLKHADLFNHFNAGSHEHRPPTKSPFANFYFAGDWLRLHRNWWMMEKAVVSGRLAANEILKTRGEPPVQVFEPRPDEFFTRVVKWVYRAARAVKLSFYDLLGYRPLPPAGPLEGPPPHA